MSLLKNFVDINGRLARWFDRSFLPDMYLNDGNRDFIDRFAPGHLASNLKIYDVGGGKQPFIAPPQKQALGLTVVGIDISAAELEKAPQGAYDSMVCADIAKYQGVGDGDLVFCQAVLEHVQDTEGAMRSIASLLKPGGKALLFVPSRNAVFARLNLLLPEKVKRWVLFTVYPSAKAAQGFPSFYARCTPKDMIAMAKVNNLKLADARYYYISSYFSFFFPFYLLWRFWIVLYQLLAGYQAAETFSFALVKVGDGALTSN